MPRPAVLADIPTPALLIDVPAMERNIARMARFFSAGPCRLRPHFKAHKTPEIARRQLAAGSCVGLTCATVSEAEVVAGLCDDLLIANELVGPGKCDRAAALATRIRLTVAVDSPAGVEELSSACRRAGATAGVLVDVNVGQMRCGIAPGPDVIALARLVARTNNVTLRGLMGYEGHLVAIPDRAERERRTREAIGSLVRTADMVRRSGLPCDVISSGGTGTYDITGRVEGVTEVQAGSYVVMDTDYARLDMPFESAFCVLGTVISRPDAGRCVADCGHKATTKDHGAPAVQDIDGAEVIALNDEHAVIGLPPGATVAIGDRIKLRPSHTDPTINLHDVFYALDGDRVIDVWPITARGYAEHRSERPVRMSR